MAPFARHAARLPRVSDPTFRRLSITAVVLLALIVVSGGAVRLTGSGLGCPDWPQCTAHSLVAPASYHPLVEFINRVISAAVTVAVLAVAAAAHLRTRPRRDLTLLSWGLVAGVGAQVVLGGLTVLFHLTPGLVMVHFLASMAVLVNGLFLVHRADPGWQPGRPPLVRREIRWLGVLLTATAGVVLVLGTVTTGTGPHAGSPSTPRFDLPLERVTQLHADSALFLTGLVVATLFALRVADTPAAVRRQGNWLLAGLLSQVAIGYAQYFSDLPAGLVELHVAGATAIWCLTVLLNLSFYAPPAVRVPAPLPRPAREGATHPAG
jgi:cytochrome c oxidase assembly protein subunit 15